MKKTLLLIPFLLLAGLACGGMGLAYANQCCSNETFVVWLLLIAIY
jgi:hypothetical protein